MDFSSTIVRQGSAEGLATLVLLSPKRPIENVPLSACLRKHGGLRFHAGTLLRSNVGGRLDAGGFAESSKDLFNLRRD